MSNPLPIAVSTTCKVSDATDDEFCNTVNKGTYTIDGKTYS